MDIPDFSAVGFVGLDVNPTMGIPEAYGTIFAAAEAIISVAVEPSSEDGTLVSPEHVSLLRRQIGLAHLTFLPGSTLVAVLLNLAGKVIVRHGFWYQSNPRLRAAPGLGRYYLEATQRPTINFLQSGTSRYNIVK